MDSEEKRIHTGELYYSADVDILKGQNKLQDLVFEFNQTRPSDTKRRDELQHQMLGSCGEGVWIEPPFHANFGGRHCHFGSGVYANFGLICVDDTHIYVGAGTMLGPNVILATAGHPLLPELREGGLQYNLPIRIGERCWLGAGVIVLPGVTIGDGTTIGAGSVVTHDIPPEVLALGVPCRVVREIGEHDRKYYSRNRRISWKDLEGRGPDAR